MRRLLVCSFVCLAACAVMEAAPACATQALSAYIAAGAAGCDVGQYNFSHFNWLVVSVGVNVNNDDPTLITVTPHDNGAAGPSLDFTLNLGTSNALLPAVAVNTLAFRVVGIDPVNALISSSTLNVHATATGLLGTAIVTETNCVGGLFTGNLCLLPGGLGTTGNVGLGGIANAGVNANVAIAPFNAPVNTVDVLKTFNIVSAGLPITPSTMTLNSITESFGAAAPEPSSWVLLATSLVLLLMKKIRLGSAA